MPKSAGRLELGRPGAGTPEPCRIARQGGGRALFWARRGDNQFRAKGGCGDPVLTRRKETMQQVKLFKGLESELSKLEAEVNDWIRDSGARVLSISGNIAPQSEAPEGKRGGLGSGFAPSDIVLVVLYETDAG